MAEHLSDLLDRVADGAPAVRHDLVADSMRRGSRLRRRRTTLRAVGASAAVALVALGASTMTTGEPEGARREAPPAATPSASHPIADLSVRRAAREAFAGYGELSAVSSRAEVGFAHLTATLTNAAGVSAGIAVVVADSEDFGFPASTPSEIPPTSCAEVRAEGMTAFRCREVGDVLVVGYRFRTDDSDPEDGVYADVVEVLHPGGLVTRVDSYNSPGYLGEQTLDEPLMDRSQLRAVALDPVWLQVRLPD